MEFRAKAQAGKQFQIDFLIKVRIDIPLGVDGNSQLQLIGKTNRLDAFQLLDVMGLFIACHGQGLYNLLRGIPRSSGFENPVKTKFSY